MEEQVLGIATCGHCQKRFRILKKHARIVGKEIQCPKCHRSFVVQLQVPTQIEQAAIAQQTEAQGATEAKPEAANTPRKRRKKSDIREEYFKKIRDVLPGFVKRLRAIVEQEASSEEQIRVWCLDVLREVLGYDDSDLDTELSALGQRIDIAVKDGNRVLMVIECKNVRFKLSTNAKDQAVGYAANKSADWAAVTNGQIWKLYQVTPVKGHDPKVVEVFDIALLDEDGISDYDVECLYLLSKRALLRGDSEKKFHLTQSLDHNRIFNALLDDRTVKLLGRILNSTYKNEVKYNVKLGSQDVRERLEELFRPDAL